MSFTVLHGVGVQNVNGSYGILQSIMQPIAPVSSAPPKWQGFYNFINGL